MDSLWLKIGSALLMGLMVILLWPRAMELLRNGPRGTAEDWKAALVPLALVVGFVVLLILMVR
ncbi:hypothetical protein [Thiohalobacter sp.]|uniref:hypothetical protein n=1 Tax=Thiohalobacter sp. TaxID=2025948 RepID=UPI0026070299|nr:hypothetical protein [Thiohalobacter sp.]